MHHHHQDHHHHHHHRSLPCLSHVAQCHLCCLHVITISLGRTGTRCRKQSYYSWFCGPIYSKNGKSSSGSTSLAVGDGALVANVDGMDDMDVDGTTTVEVDRLLANVLG